MNLENYTRLLSRNDGEQKYFTTPWGGLVLKNITDCSCQVCIFENSKTEKCTSLGLMSAPTLSAKSNILPFI